MFFLRPITSVLLLVMVFLELSRGKKQCDIPEIIRTYKAVIFYELQNLEQRILQSLYSLSVTLKSKAKCDSQRRRKKKLESAICRMTSQMTSVIRKNCRHVDQHNKDNKLHTEINKDNERKSKTRRKEFHRRVETIRICWEKLNLRCQNCAVEGVE